ncbi:MAG: hypothetical protein ACLFPL_01315 [Candidatus Nanoarchaeia archaeon]
MKYHIYSDDVVDRPQEEPSPRRTSQNRIRYEDIDQSRYSRSNFGDDPQPPSRTRRFIIFLHVVLILGVLLLIYFVIVSPFIFEDDNDFQLTGELSNFTTSLNQTIELNAQEYELDIDNRTNLAGSKERFIFYNFTGDLFLQNNTLTLIGSTPLIQTQSSKINAKNQQITLSFRKGGVQLFLETISMTISNKLDITYSPDLLYSTNEETQILISNFSGTFSQDTLIGLRGNIGSFSIENNNSKLEFE